MESSSTRRETASRSIEQPPMMSSSSDPMTERLLCSICLEVFSDPVSTPCGHNFCKICLKIRWNNSQDYKCPNCKETFNQRPDLKINTTLRELVDEHKKKSHEEQPEAEVVCDICTEGKLKAVKSCLVCQSSYCETHLESHLRVSGLQKHKLIDPVKNLQDYICQKHDRPLELFCRDDQTCVCLICTVTDHKNHNTVPIRESELQEMMENQRAAQKHNEDVIKDLKKEISEQELMIENQKAAEKQDEDVIKDLKEEITELKKRNTELEMVKQKQITAERRNDVIKHLKEEIIELKKRNTEQQQKISNTEDDLRLIQEEHQNDLSRQQKSSSERSFKFWFLVVGLLFVLSACFIQTYNPIQRPEAETLESLQSSKNEITDWKKKNNELNLDIQRREAETLERLESSKTQITELKKRNNELDVHLQRCEAGKTSEIPQPSEEFSVIWSLIGVLLVSFMVYMCFTRKTLERLQSSKTEITDLKKKNNELNLDVQRREAEIIELKKKNNELDVDLKRCKAELKLKWMQQYAVDVTLDPDTAHPKLILSDDEKQVRHGDIRHKLPDNPKRFDRYVMVLGKEGFSSGRFYYEVQVKGKTKWDLGVVRESVDRKGEIKLTPVNGFWTVWLRNENEYKACAGPSVSLSLSVKPQKVGVFVDYEEGLVSFYDVENRSHIYSYTDQSFTEKLYPYFSPCNNNKGKNSEPFIITPVN